MSLTSVGEVLDDEDSERAAVEHGDPGEAVPWIEDVVAVLPAGEKRVVAKGASGWSPVTDGSDRAWAG